MAKKKSSDLSPIVLFLISAALLIAAGLMKSFPILIFAGFAPLIAITDSVKPEQRFWNLAELILLALAAALWASHQFSGNFLVPSLLQGIAFSFAFMGQSFVSRRLGHELGKLPIVIFWLTFEYLFLNLPWREGSFYLGDTLALKSEWLGWTAKTGYSMVSFWILITNLLMYSGLFKEGKINWYFVGASAFLIVGPITYSYLMKVPAFTRTDMIASFNKISVTENFMRGVELIYRGSAGLTVLLVVAALLRNEN